MAFADDASDSVRAVQARTIELKIPADWTTQKTAAEMRVAQFGVPANSDDGEDGQLVVFYFGGPTGGIEANVKRWIGQFAAEDRKLEMFQGKCAAGSYILVDTTGTWNKPDGPPFARKTISTPNSRVLNVILIEEKDDQQDYYFMKLSGSVDLVSKHTAALRTAIGAEAETEKPFELP